MFKKFRVGGCNRDLLMDLPFKDVDFAVEAPSFEAMRDELVSEGFEIFEEKPEFFTIRAKVPKGNPLIAETHVADFVMCRKDGPSSDGRRPDFVEAGDIFDDLARRDFTMNAIAMDCDTREFLDPHGGIADIRNSTLRFVGNPMKRIAEDGLRVLRGFRFLVTKNIQNIEGATVAAMASPLAVEMLAGVSIERVHDEINRMFTADQTETFRILFDVMSEDMREAIFRDGLKLHMEVTLKSRKRRPMIGTQYSV